MPFVALPYKEVPASQSKDLIGFERLRPLQSRRKSSRFVKKVAIATHNRKIQRRHTDPSKTYKVFLEQKILAPSELPPLPPMELQALSAPPLPASCRFFEEGTKAKSIKERLGTARPAASASSKNKKKKKRSAKNKWDTARAAASRFQKDPGPQSSTKIKIK
jgi:hypothetical protein